MTAFSNSTEFDMWAQHWCHRCVKDEMGEGDPGSQCHLLNDVMIENTVPKEWKEGEYYPEKAYICSIFQGKEGEK